MEKIILVGNDIELKLAFEREAREYDFVMISADELQTYDDAKAVLISDKAVPILSLESLIIDFRNKNNIYYMISNSPKASVIENQISLCKKLDINVINPHTSLRSIVAKVLGLAEDKGTISNVIALFGTHAQVGVTSIALMVAKQLTEKDLKVAVLGLNQYNSGTTWYEKYEGNTFDEMYEELVDNHTGLTVEKLERYFHYDDNRKFRYLAGNKDYTKQNYFGAEEVDQLISMASQNHDVVLLDLGSNPSSVLALKGLERASIKLLVANQLQVSITNWLQMHSDVFRLIQITKEEFMMIVNRFTYSLPNDQKRLSELMNVPTLAMVSDFGSEGIFAESLHKLLIESSTKSVKRDITNQINEITTALFNRLYNAEGEKKEKKQIWRLGK